jgi:hypothetical protein
MPRKRGDAVLSFPQEEQVEELCQLLRLGNYVSTACGYTGIPERSVYNWLREGQTEDARPWVEQFTKRVMEARAHSQVANLQVVQRAAANGTWQAAAWFLERSNPHQWGLRSRHEVDIRVSEDTRSNRERLVEALDVISVELHGNGDDATVYPLPNGDDGPAAANGH